MTLANKFVGMNIKKASDQLASGSIITAAIEISDIKHSSKASDIIRKSLGNGKGSVLMLLIKL